MSIYLFVFIPKDEPILLDRPVWSGSLKLSCLSELFLCKDLKPPVHQYSKVQHPLSEACVHRVRSIYCVRRFWPIADSRIMRTNVERKVGHIPNTFVARGCSYGQYHRGVY